MSSMSDINKKLKERRDKSKFKTLTKTKINYKYT